MTEDINDGIRELPAEGFIRFSIKANDTRENQAIHDGFKEFARVECDNNYTQAIKALLESFQGDAKFEALWEKIQRVDARIDSHKHEDKKEEQEEGMF